MPCFAGFYLRSEVVIAVADFSQSADAFTAATHRDSGFSFDNERTMTQAALRERLATLYAALRLGQLDFVLNALDDNVEFVSYSPLAIFPFLGHRRGKAAMAEALKGAHDEFDIVSYEPLSIVAESAEAAVVLFVRGVNRKTRRSVQLSVAHFLRFKNGKIVEIKEFMDSFSAAEQVLGRDLDIGSSYHLL